MFENYITIWILKKYLYNLQLMLNVWIFFQTLKKNSESLVVVILSI